MILHSAARVEDADLSRYAWSRLRRFRNVSEVEDRIVRLHDLEARHRPNARKQAMQIRHCLLQAEEYFDAAAVVTLATKPLLYYYSIMSLALAEVLLKQSGDSSLDRAREQNNHHGLTLRLQNLPKDPKTLSESIGSLVAAPLVRPGGARFGTFDLWHRSCREMPVAGSTREYAQSGRYSTGFGVIFLPLDERPPLLPTDGLSLLDCMRHLPGMSQTMPQFGIRPNIVRARIERRTHTNPWRHDYALVIHPADAEVMDSFLAHLLFHPADGIERLKFHEMRSGGILNWSESQLDHPLRLRLPHASMWAADEVRFWPSDQALNEFGFLYVALYIVGTYARYYPDLWMRDVERSAPLALAIEELLAMAAFRMPLLALSEMERTYFVISG